MKQMLMEKYVGREEYITRRARAQISLFSNLINNSEVVNTLTKDCCLRCGSFDQITELRYKANARKSESSGSGNISMDCLRNLLYSGSFRKLIFSSTSFCLNSNSCSESFDLNKQISLYFSNSDFMNSGANIFSELRKKKIYEAAEKGFISENKILLSRTIFIFYFNSSSLSLGDNSASNLLNLSFFAFLPNSTDHLTNSFSSGDLVFSRINNNIVSLTISDKLIQGNCFNSSLTLSGIVSVTVAIYILPSFFNFSNFLSSSSFFIIPCFIISFQLTSGNLFLSSLRFFGAVIVKVAILVCLLKSVHVFKSFYLAKNPELGVIV